ncbi:hypothetical protein HAX54_045121 [Datura stramonium]|uniref:Uncharacterized protein n=1 Tax=Datura stramonium TaxID=4076 RepID=A0ABS8SQ12_DATST|nr:hypothetical protein [Datura stramonium]
MEKMRAAVLELQIREPQVEDISIYLLAIDRTRPISKIMEFISDVAPSKPSPAGITSPRVLPVKETLVHVVLASPSLRKGPILCRDLEKMPMIEKGAKTNEENLQ